MKQSNTALVAGGAGFIGSHICKTLMKSGKRVICLDNLSTGSMRNIQPFNNNPQFSFLNHDIVNPFSYDGPIDEIYNLACPASPLQYQKDPVHTFKTSILGSINLLDLAKDKGARILLASTSEVYGNPLVHPQTESYWGNVNPDGIRSCYDEGKRGAETLFCDYHRAYGVDTRIIRIFNTYGPGMSCEDGRVVSNFLVQALCGETITVNGDGTQTRSFQYVSDLVEGIMRTMEDGVSAYPINLGNPHEITINELVDVILELTGSTSQVTHQILPQDDPLRRRPDITRAQQVLRGWKPTVDLHEGLRQTMDYFCTLLQDATTKNTSIA